MILAGWVGLILLAWLVVGFPIGIGLGTYLKARDRAGNEEE